MTAAVHAASRRGGVLRLLGPAFVAAVAYVDPGNVAANLTAGAQHGYLLLWVLVAANLMAVLVQSLSARLGIVTGRSLPALVGARLGRPGRLAYWVQAELVAVATDLAEVIGGALALQLLFGLPLLSGALVIAACSLALLSLQSSRGHRVFEAVVVGLLAVIALGFTAGLVVAPLDAGAAAAGLVPRLDGPGTVVLAASMLGATVMPHAIYAHSALVLPARRAAGDEAGRRRLLRAARWDVGLSLLLAGTVNMAMLLLAAASLSGVEGTDTIPGAHDAIVAALGPTVGLAFGIGLLASGLASTAVGSYAGAEVMSGLVRRPVPEAVRRVVALVPALAVIAAGVEPTAALVVSQAVLSLGIPFAVVPLVLLSGRRSVMGEHASGPLVRAASWAVVVVVVGLNLALVATVLAGR